MNALRFLLVIMTVAIILMTGMVVSNQGWDLLSVFIDNISAVTWSGQFNLDFACYLLLSALWIMWRHKFSLSGIVLGLIASVAGILFLAPYLMVISFLSKGDVKRMLTGDRIEA